MFMRVDLAAWSLLLIALGIGYLICLKAGKEGGKLFKYGGYVIGVIILVASLLLAACDLGARLSRRRALPRRIERATTRPKTMPSVETPSAPRLPRRAVGVTEPEETAPKTGE